MESTDLEKCFTVALDLVKKGGQLIRSRIHKAKTVDIKSSVTDLVTETDVEVEKTIVSGLKAQFPIHKFIGEESDAVERPKFTDDPTWILDPVDGTMNFVHGFPHCCVSLALSVNKEIVIGIVYNPTLEQLFTAKKNQGSFLNGQRIYTSTLKELNSALIMLEVGTSQDPQKLKTVEENIKLIYKCHGLRTLGSAALNGAMVAMGAADAYVEAGIHIWDIAAITILVIEAGGVVIDPSGGPLDLCSRRFLCASSEELAKSLVDNVVQYHPKPRDCE